MEWFPPDPPPAVPHSNSCPLIEHDERARRLYSAGGSLANVFIDEGRESP